MASLQKYNPACLAPQQKALYQSHNISTKVSRAFDDDLLNGNLEEPREKLVSNTVQVVSCGKYSGPQDRPALEARPKTTAKNLYRAVRGNYSHASEHKVLETFGAAYAQSIAEQAAEEHGRNRDILERGREEMERVIDSYREIREEDNHGTCRKAWETASSGYDAAALK